MLSKNKIKFINSLKKKKNRVEKNLFLAEGEKIVGELLQSHLQIKEIFATESFSEHISQTEGQSFELHRVTEDQLKKISDLKTPNKVLAVIEIPSSTIHHQALKNSLSLVLDNINDPGNLGTIIRTADWFGIQHVICSNSTVDVYNPKVIQSTMGAIARVKVIYRDLAELITSFQNDPEFPIYGSFLKGNNIYQTSLSNRGFIIMGSESHGISCEVEQQIQKRLYIPRYKAAEKESSESLNVSVAAGILCAEFRRQHPG